jgi:hypothetical protein
VDLLHASSMVAVALAMPRKRKIALADVAMDAGLMASNWRSHRAGIAT